MPFFALLSLSLKTLVGSLDGSVLGEGRKERGSGTRALASPEPIDHSKVMCQMKENISATDLVLEQEQNRPGNAQLRHRKGLLPGSACKRCPTSLRLDSQRVPSQIMSAVGLGPSRQMG
ncbi:hypothetical protein ARMGADRAFT_1034102 [Armillaria gallica]|uniref:Uncharacterized protein n=1 Tax=Armillaria gallica TaxID=47427 RepID=A0A2H3D9N3_ARMGA|nr:hypothetical protein ARMGADRAFT_1034102 [Armillaria gallica]